MNSLTTRDVAAEFDLHPETVGRHARRLGIGTNWGGRAGRRFTEADVVALREALTPKPVPMRRRRRSA